MRLKTLYLRYIYVVLPSFNGNFDPYSSSDLGRNLIRKAVSGLLDGLPQLQVL